MSLTELADLEDELETLKEKISIAKKEYHSKMQKAVEALEHYRGKEEPDVAQEALDFILTNCD